MRVALFDDDGLVRQIARFEAAPPEMWGELHTLISECAIVGDRIVDGAILPSMSEAQAAEIHREELRSLVSAKRWSVETSGITVNGMAVSTDDRAKMMIMGARIQAEANPAFTTAWKGPTGAFVTIAAAQIIAISDAALAHVAACFAIESALLDAIDAGTLTDAAEIDGADWPS